MGVATKVEINIEKWSLHMKQKGILVILSGNSGTGKTFLQDLILQSNNTFIQIPKYISRDAREGEKDTADKFGVNEAVIKEECTWVYKQHGNLYGFNEADILDAINSGKNAILIATDDKLSYEMRQYCIENEIDLFKIHLQDKSMDTKNIEQALFAKGRADEEVKGRKSAVTRNIMVQFLEQDFCDYGINNRYDIDNGRWERSGEEVLNEFNSYFEGFLARGQFQEKCFQVLDSNSPTEAKKAYLRERWIGGLGQYGTYHIGGGLEKQISHIEMVKPESSMIVCRQLGAEHHVQRWLDKIFMNGVNLEIRQAVIDARREQLTEDDMAIRAVLGAKYRGKWEELEEPNNEMVKQFYLGLVNIVPLIEGETVADRVKILRYPYRDPNQRGYRDEESLLQRRMVEISCPYQYDI